MPTNPINSVITTSCRKVETAEVELMLCCARTRLDSANAQRLKELIGSGLNWDYLLQIAQQHDMLPLLYRHLKEVTTGVPQTVREHLRAYFQATAYRNLGRTAELRKLTHLFESHGIAALALKGPTLAAVAYGDLTLRPFLDLDILIRQHDVSRARQLLTSQGYQAVRHLSKPQERVMLRLQSHDVFIRENGRSTVELHWKLFSRHIGFSVEFEYLWQRRVLTNIADAEIPTLAPEDLLLMLCIHGTKHCWYKLKWICDIAELLRVYQQMNWSPVVSEARALGCERMLYLGLFLAHDLLGSLLPSGIEHDVASDPILKTLTMQVRQSLHQDAVIYRSPVQNYLFQVRTRQRLLDKGRFSIRLLQFLTTPNPSDWDLLRLPEVLFPCYYFIRPIRQAGKYGTRLLKAVFRLR